MIFEVSKNIVLVGTNHISEKSKKEIDKAIERYHPDIIALELDQQRLKSLFEKPSSPSPKLIRNVGVTGYLFLLIAGFIQKRLGRFVGMQPGDEMRHAFRRAHEQKKRLALIDVPIIKTLQDLSRVWTRKEKWKMFFDVIFFWRKKTVAFDIKSIPSEKQLEIIIGELAKEYPNLYKVLIANRDKHMVLSLQKLHTLNPDSVIVVVVGAGHVAGMRAQFSLIKTEETIKTL